MKKEIKKFVVELEVILEESEKDEIPEQEYIREMITHLDSPTYLTKNESIHIKKITEKELYA